MSKTPSFAILFTALPFAMIAILSLDSRSSSTDPLGMRITKPLSCTQPKKQKKKKNAGGENMTLVLACLVKHIAKHF